MDPEPNPSSLSSLESSLERIESVLHEILGHSGFELKCAIRKGKPVVEGIEGPDYVVELSGPDAELLLQKHAALLDALEYVVLKAARLEEHLFGHISFDCQDWRWLRAQELQLAARVAAERVVETGDPFTMNPMSARERRIIHLALKNQPQVRTLSEGFGPERRVVIHRASSGAAPSGARR